MNKLRLLPLFLLLCLILSGCKSGQEVSASPTPEWSLTFTDSLQNEITLTHPPQTVAVLFSSYAQIWELAGGTVAVTVGESVERGFADEHALLVDEGAGKTIDMELLLAAQPDFILASADIAAQVDACKLAAQVGVPCALFRVDTFEDYQQMLKVCTDITGNQAAYEQYGLQVAQDIQSMLADLHAQNLPKKDILFIRAGSQYSATKAKRAPENFVCSMLEELGAHNIADEAEVLLDGLSLEEILLQDPDYIFLTTMGNPQAAVSYVSDLFSQEGWRELSAVKQGNYTFLPKELFHFKPNDQWAVAYATLVQHLYPELDIHG